MGPEGQRVQLDSKEEAGSSSSLGRRRGREYELNVMWGRGLHFTSLLE